MLHYARSALARQLAEAIQGKSIFGDAHNGLFLAAPRRTGKSTFLQADLKPELEHQGLVVVYVDLWSDRHRDPGDLISDAIGRALAPHLSMLAKAAKAAKLEHVTIAGALKIDVGKIGRVDGITLPEALRVLRETAKTSIVLIVDEAQHALTSEVGENVMAALKSARDQLNIGGEVNLMLIMSGSDRDKLLRLVNTNGAPFYGSQIQRMPELDENFIAYVAGLVEEQRPELKPVDIPALIEAFNSFGRRPQFFMEALGQALSPLAGITGRFEKAVLAAAGRRQQDEEAQMEADYLGLEPLERALLWRMLEQAQHFRPYDADAMNFYRTITGKKVTTQQIQKAVESLRQHTPVLIWKSARGEYAVDDAAMHRWYRQRVEAGAWPPVSRMGEDRVE